MADYNDIITNSFNVWIDQALISNNIEVTDQIRADLMASHEMTVNAIERFSEQRGPLGGAGVGMFAEWVAAGTVIRSFHGEPALRSEDIDEFLPAAADFLNTLFCPPPV